MAMNSTDMANYIQDAINEISDPKTAVETFYSALCSYVEENAVVTYSWNGIQPGSPPKTDTTTSITAKIKTAGELSLSGEKKPTAANSAFSRDLNSAASTWTIEFPSDFKLTPCFVLPTISITPSGANNRNSAWLFVCSQIIAGLKKATPAATGSHGSYLAPAGKGASFVSIV